MLSVKNISAGRAPVGDGCIEVSKGAMTEFISTSETETMAQAEAFGAALRPGNIVALKGPLGAGKTLFCRGMARALGYSGLVNSPTYALVHEYAGRMPIYHMDLYRLAPGADWEEIGLSHYLDCEGVCLIEWPERLPAEIKFTHEVELGVVGATERRVMIKSGHDSGR
jgi:tRNA threonylcarbamoyladenosine biosynthesis protein TsaE